jgi:hypothetical protein
MQGEIEASDSHDDNCNDVEGNYHLFLLDRGLSRSEQKPISVFSKRVRTYHSYGGSW